MTELTDRHDHLSGALTLASIALAFASEPETFPVLKAWMLTKASGEEAKADVEALKPSTLQAALMALSEFQTVGMLARDMIAKLGEMGPSELMKMLQQTAEPRQ